MEINWKAMIAVLGLVMAALYFALSAGKLKHAPVLSAVAILSYTLFVLLSMGGQL